MFVSIDEATILHADLDSFFASVEQRDDPRLLGRPVIVGAGVVLAASYEAKAFGVKTRDARAEGAASCARTRSSCRRASRPTARRSKDVFAIFDDTSPVVEGMSIDEAFLDVRGMRRIAGAPVEIAARLRAARARGGRAADHGRRRADEVPGEGRPSAVAKPDGLLLVEPDGELEFLHPLPVEQLWGVGVKTADKLHARGINDGGGGGGAVGARAGRDARARRRGGSCTRSRTTAIRGRSTVGRRRRSIGGQRAIGRRGQPKAPEFAGRGAGRADRPDHAAAARGAAGARGR